MIHQTHIFRIKNHLVLMEIVEGLFEVVKQIILLFLLHHYVVNVGFDVSPNLRLQDDVNTLLICGSPIF
jgi:tRNA A22 N-methylase